MAYIIPAFSESANSRRYKTVFEYFKNAGIITIPIEIKWSSNSKTPSDYRKEFLAQYNKFRKTGDVVYLFGYSIGAHIALVAAQKVKPKFIILCSLAPWFSETIPKLPKQWMQWHSKWIPDYKKLKFAEIARNINARVLIFVGSKEPKLYIDQAKSAKRLIKNSMIVIVPRGRHALGQKEYQASLERYLP